MIAHKYANVGVVVVFKVQTCDVCIGTVLQTMDRFKALNIAVHDELSPCNLLSKACFHGDRLHYWNFIKMLFRSVVLNCIWLLFHICLTTGHGNNTIRSLMVLSS